VDSDSDARSSNSQRATKAPTEPRARRRGDADGIDMGILPELLGYNLRRAHLTVFQRFAADFARHDISAPQYGTLILIDANPGISQSAVAEALRFDRSTLVQIIDRLEKRGLVVREVAAHDRRSHALRLTADGRALLAKLVAVGAKHERAIAAALTAAEREALVALLEKVYRAPPRQG
jgi:DNA-binding MarR family transcriptional regulator